MNRLPILTGPYQVNLFDLQDRLDMELNAIRTICDALNNPIYGMECDHIAVTLQGVYDRLEAIKNELAQIKRNKQDGN